MSTDLRKLQWHIARSSAGQTLLGPLTSDEVGERLLNGTLSWADCAWTSGLEKTWQRIYQIPLFQSYLTAMPSDSLLGKIQEPQAEIALQGGVKHRIQQYDFSQKTHEAPKQAATSHLWFLKYDDSEFGPLTIQEVFTILTRDKLQGTIRIRSGNSGDWVHPADLKEFKEFFLTGKLPIGRKEKRSTRRKDVRGLVQFTRIREGGELSPNSYTGIVENLSATGALISSESRPAKVGLRFQLQLSFTDVPIPSFRVEGELVRLIGNEKFAIRFSNLPEEIGDKITEFALQKMPKSLVVELWKP